MRYPVDLLLALDKRELGQNPAKRKTAFSDRYQYALVTQEAI
jgi:hypothetical protein